MPQNVTEALTSDERSVLEIAASGEPIAEIGRWEKPVLALEKRGYLEGPKFNKCITAAGEAAYRAQEAANDAQIGRYIETVSRVATAQQEIAQLVEQAAALLATAALKTQEVRGDAAETALINWNSIAMTEARNLIREKQRA